MLYEVITRAEAGGDADVHVLELPADAHVAVNALQRRATIVVQKSIREGFGLTVTRITSYNVCYTKLLRSTPPGPSGPRTCTVSRPGLV